MIDFQKFKVNIKRICRELGTISISKPEIYIENEPMYAKHWYADKVLPPHQISVEVSSRCNLRCQTCSKTHSGEQNSNDEDMSIELFEKVLNQTSSFCNSYNLHGIGESLMHPEFVKFVELVKEKNAICRLTTNGLLLNHELIYKLLIARIDSVTFSLDAATPETYLKIRSSKLFQKVIDNLKQLIEMRKEHGLGVPVISTAFLCVKDNIKELADFVQLSADIGVDSVFIQSYENRGWGTEHQLSAQKKFMDNLYEAEKTANENKISLQYDFPERIALETGQLKADNMPVWDNKGSSQTERPRFRACEAPYLHGIIRVNGDVDTCYYGETLGNVNKTNFSEIWNNRKSHSFRKRLRTVDNPPLCCQKCNAKGWHYYQPQHEITDSLTMGKHDNSQMGLGWHARDNHGGTIFRFTDMEATAIIRNTGKPFLLLELCAVSEANQLGTRKVEVYVNSRYVGCVVADTKWKPFLVKLPICWSSFLKITLKVEKFNVPCRTTDSFDIRRLGVGVARLELRAKFPVEWWREA